MRWLALLLLATGAARADAPGPSFGSASRFTEVGGAAIYGSVCAGCHMADGRGAAGAGAYPALLGDPALASADYVQQMVLYGHGAMPGFRRTLSDEQVAAVVRYVQHSLGDHSLGDVP